MPLTGDRFQRLLRAGLLTAVVDGLFSSVLSIAFYHSTVARLFQGVASVLIGKTALDGGIATALIGLAMHFGVAFGWSAVFLLVASSSSGVRRILGSRYGALKVASVYGPAIWLIMSCVVIPLLAHRPPRITVRWWTQFFGHIPFVGLPIVSSIARASDAASARAR
jgi:uncharacterized membrane protein YagU involved in acid resistance